MNEDHARTPLPADVEEHRRIRRVYADYEGDAHRRGAWADTPGSRYMREEKWRRIVALLKAGGVSLGGAWGIDLGSGSTGDVDRLEMDGARLRAIVALDLLPERLAEARGANPRLVPVAADAARMPVRSASVGVVYQSTMISSVLDETLRTGILAEVRRVLKPGGVFVSYDTRYPNPWNRNTRPLPLGALRRGFGGWMQAAESITGIPQIVRILAPLSTTACRLVAAVPLLRSHLLFVAIKPAGIGAR